MGILSTIGKSIKDLNITSNLKRAGALAAAIIVIPVEAAATAADAKLSNIDKYKTFKEFCSKSVEAISKAAKATAEFTKISVETMEATAQIAIGQPVVDRLQKVVEAIQKRADKLQGEEKEIIRDPQKFREDRAERKEIWRESQASPDQGTKSTNLEESSVKSSVEPSTSSTAETEADTTAAKKSKSSERATMWGRVAQAVKDAVTVAGQGVKTVSSVTGQAVAKGTKSVASGAANVGSKIAEDRKFRTAERHLFEKVEEIKAAKQDLLKKNPKQKEGEAKIHKTDENIMKQREERTTLATALGIKEEKLKEKLKPLKARAERALGVRPDPTPLKSGAAKSNSSEKS